MNDAFRYALVVKMGDFFPQDKIFEQRWATITRTKRILVVGNAHALVGGEGKTFAAFAVIL